MNIEYRFVSKYDENTEVSTWKESRIEMNKIIESYNNWQIEDDFNIDKSRKVLAKIEYGKQTVGKNSDVYMEELESMESFVKGKNK